MGLTKRLLIVIALCFVSFLTIPSKAAESFKCSTNGATCRAIVDYVLPNSTALSAIQTLFNVSNLNSLLGANNFPLSTLPSASFPANQTIKIPFPCRCANGIGMSDHTPIYRVVPDDGLSHIAEQVFSRLMTYEMIQKVNNIPDPNQITVGQELWIPLPCSCDDDEDGKRVVHYGLMVTRGSTVSGIARQYNVSDRTLLSRNDLDSPDDLKFGTVLDIPLPVCSSMVGNGSLDSPLLVPNGTYTLTANSCVTCKCDAAKNWTLQCQPSQLRPTAWLSCPSMQCQGAENLHLGNTTSSNCSSTTCAYAGYNNQTIFTELSTIPTCPAPTNSATKFGLQGSDWSVLVSVHLALLSLFLAI